MVSRTRRNFSVKTVGGPIYWRFELQRTDPKLLGVTHASSRHWRPKSKGGEEDTHSVAAPGPLSTCPDEAVGSWLDRELRPLSVVLNSTLLRPRPMVVLAAAGSFLQESWVCFPSSNSLGQIATHIQVRRWGRGLASTRLSTRTGQALCWVAAGVFSGSTILQIPRVTDNTLGHPVHAIRILPTT